MDKNNNVLCPDILREISQEVTITQLDSLPTAEVTPTTTVDLERRKIERIPKSTRKQNCWAMSAYEDWAKWRNSQVWKYFKKSSDKQSAICQLRSATIQLHGGTSNLRSHIRHKHPSEGRNNATPERERQTTLTHTFAPGPRPASNEEITRALTDFVVQAYVPMKLVEHDSFRQLMTLVAPQYEVPSRTTITSRIGQMYDTEKASLTSSLNGCQSASLTTDTWTSTSTESYLTVTAHYIDEDWCLHSSVLMTRAMPERHTGENIAARLTDCVDEFNLKGRVAACVHDNARNMDSAGRMCEEWEDLPCFAHTLQLCVKPVFEIEEVESTVARCQKLVGHFRHSTTLTAELRSRRVTMGLPDHELIQDVPTRWNSTQQMLMRLVEQRLVVTDILINPRLTKKNDRSLLLTDAEWEVASEVAEALKDLTTATEFMCKDKYVSCSDIYPVVCGLLVNSLGTLEDDSDILKRVKETVREELRRRFQPHTTKTAGSTPVIAALLDIRHKRLNFLSRELKRATRSALESKLDDVPLRVQGRDECLETPAKRPCLSFLISSPSESTAADEELEAYLREKSQPNADPFSGGRITLRDFPPSRTWHARS